ncbi:MAG TPA: sigma-54 dependent transcriptional regulator [bacterium]|nr:sigma-54 dependent transcriptional regulator [bacterium]HQG44260.1 sigma-54 dependent transcriptional regulator [bacterium]HQI48303.1 sigma-54 dependent transcriptional regulator [bacterium]HQJ64193.1 sigma-54 dependent transcriptional regulator [bacterium]
MKYVDELQLAELHQDVEQHLRPDLSYFETYYPKLSRCPEIQKIYSLIDKIARSNATVLIQGETGTGKELIAGAIQAQSLRSREPYVTVNCAALPEHLLESELFGHERGAFTGAVSSHAGKFEQADGGTLFLDEIGDMHPSTQAKILRVLQEQAFIRVGGERTIHVDVRIIAATNKDLWEEMESGRFRTDLYYRLNVVTMHVPPLRERSEDILILADYFRRKFAAEIKKSVGDFDDETRLLLANHSWPGNIRELRNLVERAVLVVNPAHMITAKDLALTGKDYFAAGGRDRRRDERRGPSLHTLNLEELEKTAITIALQRSKWVQKEAAVLLGISPRALNYKIAQHKISHASWRKNSEK